VGNIDPQQELFTAYKLALEAMGYAVYDGELPPEKSEDNPEGAEYPFIYLGDFRQSDQMLKNAVTGFVYPTINVWHNNTKQRGTVSKILTDIKWVIYNLDKTKSYSWLVQSVDTNIIPDNTTKPPLLHGIVNAGLKFS
jgi:hypothetical protein